MSLILPASVAVSLAVAVGGHEVSKLGLILLAAGTICGYGLDRLIDRRELDPPRLRKAMQVAVFLSAILAFILACTAFWRFIVCALLGVLATGYVPLKRVLPKSTVTVSAWTIAVCALPFDSPPDFNGRHAGIALTIALIVLANMVLCDLPTVEEDRRARVRGFAACFGVRAGAVFAGLSAILGATVAASNEHFGLAVSACCLVPFALVLGKDPTVRWARWAVDLALFVVPGPITLLIPNGQWPL